MTWSKATQCLGMVCILPHRGPAPLWTRTWKGRRIPEMRQRLCLDHELHKGGTGPWLLRRDSGSRERGRGQLKPAWSPVPRISRPRTRTWTGSERTGRCPCFPGRHLRAEPATRRESGEPKIVESPPASSAAAPSSESRMLVPVPTFIRIYSCCHNFLESVPQLSRNKLARSFSLSATVKRKHGTKFRHLRVFAHQVTKCTQSDSPAGFIPSSGRSAFWQGRRSPS